MRDPDGRIWNTITGGRGPRAGGRFHNAIDVGAPSGTPIHFIGFVPWEKAFVVEAVPPHIACAPESPPVLRNAGSVLILQSRIGDLRITRRIFHSDLEVETGQIIRAGDVLGRVSDHGRTRRNGRRRGTAPHVHYEVWIASTLDPENHLGENTPLSQLEERLLAEIQKLAGDGKGTTRLAHELNSTGRDPDS